MNGYSLLWVFAAVVFGVFEALTVQLVSVWFCISALLTAVVAVFVQDAAFLFVFFVIFSAVLIVFTRPFFKRAVAVKFQPTNYDRIIGKEALVTVEINPLKNTGQVRVDSQIWSAKCDEVVAVGELVRVESVEGVRAVVKRQEVFS